MTSRRFDNDGDGGKDTCHVALVIRCVETPTSSLAKLRPQQHPLHDVKILLNS